MRGLEEGDTRLVRAADSDAEDVDSDCSMTVEVRLVYFAVYSPDTKPVVLGSGSG